MLYVYFGSATGEFDEESRLQKHDELCRLRKPGAVGVLHLVATSSGAVYKFYALHRFPQILDNDFWLPELQAKMLALICKSIHTLNSQDTNVNIHYSDFL